jgi:glucosyl-dolichyl phosphate glucuronosyltransferase
MDVTVVICTYNRSELLAQALESVSRQALPSSIEWEVLVVDNNSTDRTSPIVQEYIQRSPGLFRYLFEPAAGKSHALNAAIREARGDILAFTDDDVTVEPTWLQNLTAELQKGEWAGAGGPVLPQRSFSLPPWLSADYPRTFAPLALFNLGPRPCALRESPYGNNMAFRRTMFEKYGGFRTDLGPQPDSRNSRKCEDSEFGHRLLAAGERLRYEPSAKVYHAMPETRLRKQYFLTWWFDKGRSDLCEFGIPSGVKWIIGGIPLYLFRRLIVWTLRWAIAVVPSRKFFCHTQVRWLVGQIVESWQRRGTFPGSG